MLTTSSIFVVVLLIAFNPSAYGIDSSLAPQSPLGNSQSKELKLEDLGFKPEETTPDLGLQLRLESRTHELKAHQVTGLVTLALMTASVALSGEVKHNDIHEVLGETAAATYWTTFYLAESAPKPPDTVDRGLNIKIHKAMTWIHAPLMILTPIVGLIAQNQLYSGYNHPPAGDLKDLLGITTFVSYAIGTTVMFIEF
jgi:hypothetical protein